MTRKRAKNDEGIIVLPLTQFRPPTPVDPPSEPKALTEKEALDVLWSAKGAFVLDDKGQPKRDGDKLVANPNWCRAFVYATLTREAVMQLDGDRKRTASAGTRVLVTMVSRFGDVGIRDDHLVPASNGYYSRVFPDALTDWNMAP